jgi:hypothetical protein
VEQVILDCLQPDPSKRPGSAQEIARRLRQANSISRRTILASSAVAVSLVALIAETFRLWRREPDLPERSAVLLASLNNTTNDRRLDGMAVLLRDQLMQSARLNVLNDGRVSELLSRMQSKASPLNLDVATAREVALRNRGTLVIYANISSLGPDFSLDLKVEQPGSRPDFARRSWDHRFTASGEQDLLGRAREAGLWIRQIAGESSREIDFQDRSPQDITTFSWDALALLGAARQKRRQGLPNDAISLLREALRIDPQFPSAARDLADLLVSQRRYREGYEAWDNAIKNSRLRQLHSRERYHIEALYYDDILDLGQAERVNQAWVAAYPYDYLPHFLLGNIYLRQRRLHSSDGTRQSTQP